MSRRDYESAAVAARAAVAAKNLSRIEDDLGELIVQNSHNVSNGIVIETFGSPKPQVLRQTKTYRRKTQ